MTDNPTILLVNADESLLTVLSYTIERYGYIVNSAKNGNDAIAIADQLRPSLIIIDDNINKLGSEYLSTSDCYTILRTKISTKNISTIIISEDSEQYKKLDNFSGVTEFITKPFVPSELISSIKNLFKRASPIKQVNILEYKDLKMNISAYRVTRNGQNIHLGPTEFKILQCLMELPSKILSREHIMKHVWGYNSQIEPRTIDVHINRLRSALKNDNDNDIPLIKTVRSAGYCLSYPRD